MTSAGATVTGTLAASGAVTASTTLAVTGAITATAGINAPNTFGFKNRIINGGMVINQRAFNGATGNEIVTLDRWMTDRSGGAATATVSQSTTAPSTFSNSLLYTVGTGSAPATTDYSNVRQYIEGFNTVDLAFGTASASAVTLSFWVRSSLTGTFGVSLNNSGYDRNYIASYTISVANTWEYKTVTISGDTSGTWIGATNGVGLRVIWDLGVGPTYSEAASGSWTSSLVFGLTGGTKLTTTSGATFYITGVQLEKGSTATSFDFRDYGRELMMCQRYLPAWSGLNSLGTGQSIGSTNCRFNLPLPVTARVSPTGVSVSSAAHFATNNSAGTNLTGTSVTFLNAGTLSAWFDISVASGLTAGNASQVFATSSSALLYLTGCEL